MAEGIIIQRTEALVTVICFKCGILFAMPDYFEKQRKQDRESFYCPNGHGQCYRDSEASVLRKQLARREQELAAEQSRHAQTRAKRDELDKSLTATRGVITRLKNRASNGVCPCCHRTFRQLTRHMAKKHPGWKESEV